MFVCVCVCVEFVDWDDASFEYYSMYSVHFHCDCHCHCHFNIHFSIWNVHELNSACSSIKIGTYLSSDGTVLSIESNKLIVDTISFYSSQHFFSGYIMHNLQWNLKWLGISPNLWTPTKQIKMCIQFNSIGELTMLNIHCIPMES